MTPSPVVRSPREHGYTLVEVLMVTGLIAVLSAIAVLVMPFAQAAARADASSAGLVSVLRMAREQAISQRRAFSVTFTDPNQVVIQRVDLPGEAATPPTTYTLDAGVEFRLFTAVPDTPDAFGNTAATWFGGALTVSYTSEGEFVDENGDPANGSVFIGRNNEPLSARAVTIFGPTALVREWHWNGVQWND
jgi:prepilin-type N-terminal cleavage/methylation domain-containing protein